MPLTSWLRAATVRGETVLLDCIGGARGRVETKCTLFACHCLLKVAPRWSPAPAKVSVKESRWNWRDPDAISPSITIPTQRARKPPPPRFGPSDGRRTSFKADVGSAADVDRMFASVDEKFPTLHILVNNAGVQTWKALLDLQEAEWDRVIDTNLKGTFLCTQRAARQMKDNGGGSIVNIGSGCNKVAFPHLVDYTASKGGIEMFTKVAAAELGEYKIRVNCVAPGAIEIERTKNEAGDYGAPVGETDTAGPCRRARGRGTHGRFSWRSDSADFISGRRYGSMADCSASPHGHTSRHGNQCVVSSIPGCLPRERAAHATRCCCGSRQTSMSL